MVHYRVSFKDLKPRIPGLKQDDYNAKYAELKRDFANPPDPKIVFKDGAKTIEIHYYGEDLLIYNKPLANALKSKFPVGEGSTANMLDAAFSTKEGADRKTEVLDSSRAALRDLPYQDVPATTPAPSAAKTPLQNLKDIAASNPKGVSFGGGHGDPGRNALMDQLLADPGHGGLNLFFIEELGVVDQPLIDQFLASPKGTPLPPILKTRVGAINGMEAMLIKMRDHNAANPTDTLKAYGMNSAEAKSRDGMLGLENRVAMMNAIAKEAIDNALKANPGKKFMTFVGAAHSNTHPGGVPGMSQIFGVPAVKLDGSGKIALDSEDKSLRGMPSAAEMKKIEKMVAEFEKDSKCPTDQDKRHEYVQKFIAQTRLETFNSLDRKGKQARLEKQKAQGIAIGSDEEMAEEILMRAERKAVQTSSKATATTAVDVKGKKHDELVKDLVAQLKALSPDKKGNRDQLITDLSDAVAGGTYSSVYLKDPNIKKGTAHVSLNVATAKQTWVRHLATL